MVILNAMVLEFLTTFFPMKYKRLPPTIMPTNADKMYPAEDTIRESPPPGNAYIPASRHYIPPRAPHDAYKSILS